MKKIKAVIFDLDGTVADTIPLVIKAFRQAIEPLAGRSVSDAEITATFGPSEEGTILALAPGSYDKGLADYLAHYEALHDMCPAPFAGIEDILKTLKDKGVRIAMVTGKGKTSADISMRRWGLGDYFEVIETGIKTGPNKPQGIRNVMNYFSGLGKDEVIYVGDTPSDITSCREAGIPIVSAAWAASAEPEKLRELSPDAMFHTVADFSEWLNARI
jgi:phosphoglycolate phosphatase/pyrophosphatase PpaX